DGQVNRPQFRSYIKFMKSSTSYTIYEIDVSQSEYVTYKQDTLNFYTNDTTWSEGQQYYITFDEGVLYSNQIQNSTVQYDQNFWKFRVIDAQEAHFRFRRAASDDSSSTYIPGTMTSLILDTLTSSQMTPVSNTT
ncbi:unnamed protein product, partial [Didymodactylos carnosus]